MVCAGDIPTLETLAAVDWLRNRIPDLKIRVANVVDLMTLQPQTEHPHGISDKECDSLFTRDKPIVFNLWGGAFALPPAFWPASGNAEQIRLRNVRDIAAPSAPR